EAPARRIDDVAPGGRGEATGAALAFLLFLARTAGATLGTRGGPRMATRKLPPAYVRFARAYPRLRTPHTALGDTLLADGPLDRRTAALVKVGIAVGARLEGGVHAHTRRALE